ncbi:Putative Holliday junction resolvase [Salmonella enterica subsp. enterica serovar Typhimurium str. DT104]|nr:Putative Holliday junction resolvase [Salmonella enterica subsp. enterica serovar Typhimurium str. DT104]
MVEYFADLVKKNYEIKVVFQDERLTTKQAQTFLLDLGISFKKRQKVIDKLAAQIILERFLNTKKG